MERNKTKLMIEDNTIYEIDLACLQKAEEQERKRKQLEEKRGMKRKNKNRQ